MGSALLIRGRKMVPKLDLIYFDVRARAECARMTLAYGGIPYNFTDTQGYFGCDFMTAKTSGKLPWGQLPLLAVDGKLISQSGSINRYLASLVTKPDFIPKDPVKAALADALHETAQDLYRIMPIVNMYKGDQWKQEKEDYFTKTLPNRLPALVKMLGDQSYFCGDDPTYADFALHTIMDLVRLVEPGVVSQHANIAGWMTRVEQLPGVKEYVESRPDCVDIGVAPKQQKKN